MLRTFPLFLGVLVAFGNAVAQEATTSAPLMPQRDLQAVSLAGQTYQALVGLTPLQDISIQASAMHFAGSDEETGTATMQVRGGASRMVLSLSDGQRQEVFNSAQGVKGAWAGADGIWHPQAIHNSWINENWIFPAFALQAALNDSTYSVVYQGLDKLDGAAVVHLTLYRILPKQLQSANELIKRLTTLDVYLDPASSLPVAIAFNIHPDDNAGLDIPVEIRYSDYKTISGVLVPTHVQKLVQGSVTLDLRVTGVAVNSGLAESVFAIPATVAPVSPIAGPDESGPSESTYRTSPADGGAQ